MRHNDEHGDGNGEDDAINTMVVLVIFMMTTEALGGNSRDARAET